MKHPSERRPAVFTLNSPTAPRLCPELAKEIGLNESLLFLQLEFWLRQSGTLQEDGQYWIYESVTDIQEVFSFWSRATVNRIVHSLVEKELLQVGNFNKHRYDRTRWFTLNRAGIDKLHSIRVGEWWVSQNETANITSNQNDTRSNQNETCTAQSGTTIPDLSSDLSSEEEPPLADFLTPDTGLHDTNQERLQRIQQCADPDGAMEQYEDKPTVEDSHPTHDIDGIPLPKELWESWEKLDDDVPVLHLEESGDDDATFWAEGETPPEPSPHEPVEQGKARRCRELGTDPLGVASVVVQNRAEAAYPDGGDPSKDGDPWADGPLTAFCALVHRHTLKDSESKNWPTELAHWAKDWSATPQETIDAIKAVVQSELNWQTYKTPFSDSFKETMDMMIDRLRNNLPVNAKGKGNGNSTSRPVQGDERVSNAIDAMFDETGRRRPEYRRG